MDKREKRHNRIMILCSMAKKGCEIEELHQTCVKWGVTRETANGYLNEVSQRMLKALERKLQ